MLITSRLNAPLIQIIPDGSPTRPSSDRDMNGLEGENRATTAGAAGHSNNTDLSPHSQRHLFYTNESKRGYSPAQPLPRHPGDQQCRNSLPRVSLTSLGRAFTPRSSWNGSKAALLQLQRKSSRTDGGVPGYLAKKYHLTNASDRSAKDQVCDKSLIILKVRKLIFFFSIKATPYHCGQPRPWTLWVGTEFPKWLALGRFTASIQSTVKKKIIINKTQNQSQKKTKLICFHFAASRSQISKSVPNASSDSDLTRYRTLLADRSAQRGGERKSPSLSVATTAVEAAKIKVH